MDLSSDDISNNCWCHQVANPIVARGTGSCHFSSPHFPSFSSHLHRSIYPMAQTHPNDLMKRSVGMAPNSKILAFYSREFMKDFCTSYKPRLVRQNVVKCSWISKSDAMVIALFTHYLPLPLFLLFLTSSTEIAVSIVDFFWLHFRPRCLSLVCFCQFLLSREKLLLLSVFFRKNKTQKSEREINFI